ncbi:MAG: ATP-binding cassette domain-containing protein [Lactobacillus sp.]|jgi:lincosamide and streptogramin A transport system ATP-binding/permease protein|nr:ATP-binding cassette domain-containing protein [Lactobacillus sp.]
MSQIKIANLTFRYANQDQNLFNHLNANLDTSWKLGLVGRNGRGKTTLLNLLRGKLSGTGQIASQTAFAYFPEVIADTANLTYSELTDTGRPELWKIKRELNLMQVDEKILWQPFASLSGGEQTKVLLALAFAEEGAFPLLDEPTNHLDQASRQQIAKYLRQKRTGYIVVSHDREFLNQTTDHILAIEQTEINVYQGNFARYELTKERRDQTNQAKNNKLQREIGELNQSRQRIKGYSDKAEREKYAGAHQNELVQHINRGFYSHKAAKIMQRSKNAERRMNQEIADKEGLLVNIEQVPALSMNFTPDYHHELLHLDKFALSLADGRQLFHDLNISMPSQGIVALTGANGTGKTTLLRYLLGQRQGLQARGIAEQVAKLKISYLPQQFDDYTGSLQSFAQKQHLSYSALLNNLKKMGFPRASFATPIEQMSLGQQKRVALAKSLVEPANLYLWDEPANYLDVFNQDQLIKFLQEGKPAMILVEHDAHFIEAVAQTTVKLG